MSRDTADLLAFLKRLTDRIFLSDRRLSNSFESPGAGTLGRSIFTLHGKVVAEYPDKGVVALYHSDVPDLLPAIKARLHGVSGARPRRTRHPAARYEDRRRNPQSRQRLRTRIDQTRGSALEKMMRATRFIAPLPALLALAACGSGHRLQFYGPVPDFELISQTGRRIALADLKGKVWVADTVFTTCTGPCPMMSARMRRLALESASVPNVRMVSFTVDPAHDTPEALLEYSKHFPAAPNRWLFLTGRQSVLNRVSMDGLHLSHVDGSLDHSEEFVLVDANAVVRGFYFPFDKDRLKQLASHIRYLARS